MGEKCTNRGQNLRKGTSNIAENRQRELIDKFEKGDPSAFQELLANDLDQLQQRYQTIAANEDNSGGLTINVMKAVFAGIQAKIADRSFAHWVAGTAAEVSIDYLRDARTS